MGKPLNWCSAWRLSRVGRCRSAPFGSADAYSLHLQPVLLSLMSKAMVRSRVAAQPRGSRGPSSAGLNVPARRWSSPIPDWDGPEITAASVDLQLLCAGAVRVSRSAEI